jgi:hypothetical protein
MATDIDVFNGFFKGTEDFAMIASNDRVDDRRWVQSMLLHLLTWAGTERRPSKPP